MSKPEINEKNNVVDERKFATFEHNFNDPWQAKEISLSFQFAKPSKTQIKRLTDTASRNPTQASRALLFGCIHPDEKEKFTQALEEYAGIATSYSTALLKAVGISSDLGN